MQVDNSVGSVAAAKQYLDGGQIVATWNLQLTGAEWPIMVRSHPAAQGHVHATQIWQSTSFRLVDE